MIGVYKKLVVLIEEAPGKKATVDVFRGVYKLCGFLPFVKGRQFFRISSLCFCKTKLFGNGVCSQRKPQLSNVLQTFLTVVSLASVSIPLKILALSEARI